MTAFEQVLEQVLALTVEEQNILLETVRKRRIGERRKEFVESLNHAIALDDAGLLRSESAEEIIERLRASLESENAKEKRSRIEARRKEIAENGREAVRAFRAGELRNETLEELLERLHSSLDDEDESDEDSLCELFAPQNTLKNHIELFYGTTKLSKQV